MTALVELSTLFLKEIRVDGGNDQSYFWWRSQLCMEWGVVKAYLLRLIIARNLKMRKGNTEDEGA